jgi:hypothetical protein
MTTYDISLFAGAIPGQDTLVTQLLTTPGGGGEYVTGIAKLAQLVLIELQTELGSCADDPTRGSTFFTKLRQGYIYTETSLKQEFAFAAGYVVDRLKLSQTADTPLEEQLTSLELTGVTLIQGQVIFSMTMTSAAGTAHAIILPTKTVPVSIR